MKAAGNPSTNRSLHATDPGQTFRKTTATKQTPKLTRPRIYLLVQHPLILNNY